MIIDKIENRNFYKLPEKLREALEYMANTDLLSLEAGSYPLENGLEMDVDDYVPTAESKNFEGHEYITHLRYIVKGCERLGYANKGNVTFVEDKSKDKQIYKGPASMLRVTEGSFVVLFPQDCHALKMKDEEGVQVRKVSVSINERT